MNEDYEQVIADEKAAIRRRVLDMAFGAFGWCVGAEEIDPDHPDHSGMFAQLSPECIGRWMGAVAIRLMRSNREGDLHYLLKPHCIHEWDDINEIVDSLHAAGVRA